MTQKITSEMANAWGVLQAAAKGAYRLQPEVRAAINVLDNSDYMVPIEEADAAYREAAQERDRSALMHNARHVPADPTHDPR